MIGVVLNTIDQHTHTHTRCIHPCHTYNVWCTYRLSTEKWTYHMHMHRHYCALMEHLIDSQTEILHKIFNSGMTELPAKQPISWVWCFILHTTLLWAFVSCTVMHRLPGFWQCLQTFSRCLNFVTAENVVESEKKQEAWPLGASWSEEFGVMRIICCRELLHV